MSDSQAPSDYERESNRIATAAREQFEALVEKFAADYGASVALVVSKKYTPGDVSLDGFLVSWVASVGGVDLTELATMFAIARQHARDDYEKTRLRRN